MPELNFENLLEISKKARDLRKKKKLWIQEEIEILIKRIIQERLK